MVLVIRDGLQLLFLILTKFKGNWLILCLPDIRNEIWRRFIKFSKFQGKSTTWRNKWNRKNIFGYYAPWLKDGIYAVKNIGVEVLMYIQIFILLKAAYLLEEIQRPSLIRKSN